ncbi:carbohydrate ABC transporter permease [Bogoriella caseilytica]|uniref:Alpha-1,4-digalacturonate transport system permease protein n=1 Tax=Bogoriella caseilytica TaxID=56055 RepID=A0A3N2BD14_9MICO|nr:sugar ABC transporter permease [Bogoriella caseilytica]ROR73125.1 alpha-1,4-digalacturonate transport system permease protein [Bogoriella caseilytica]
MTTLTSAPSAGPELRKEVSGRRRRRPKYRLAPAILIAGAAILFALFFFWPGVLGLAYSLTDYRGYGDWDFVGLENYRGLIGDPEFYRALGRTMVYALFSVPLGYALALAMAVTITNPRARGKTPARIIFFLPWLVSPIVTGVIWRWMFGENFGFVNYMITSLGGERLSWSTNADLSLAVVVFASAWAGAAFNMLLFIAALSNVPISLYEAAELDGAGPWRKFRSITLPSIAPTSVLVILLLTLGQMKEFAMIQALNGGGPGTANRLMIQYIYETGFERAAMGYASAASMIFLVVLLALAFIQLMVSRRGKAKAW